MAQIMISQHPDYKNFNAVYSYHQNHSGAEEHPDYFYKIVNGTISVYVKVGDNLPPEDSIFLLSHIYPDNTGKYELLGSTDNSQGLTKLTEYNVFNKANSDQKIDINTREIAKNKEDVEAYKLLLNNNDVEIRTNKGDIATNTRGITANKSDIATNQRNIGKNVSDIAQNRLSITEIRNAGGGGGGAAYDDRAVKQGIATNKASIRTNQGHIGTLNGKITKNINDIATNKQQTSALVPSIQSNGAEVVKNRNNIATNTQAIANIGSGGAGGSGSSGNYYLHFDHLKETQSVGGRTLSL